MNKLNMIALALATLSASSCAKSAAEKAAESFNLNSKATPVSQPSRPAAVKWNGPGTLKMTGMPETACASVTAEILEDANGFELSKFGYDCSGTTADMATIRLDLRAGELFLGANKVGTKQDGLVQFEIHDPSGANLGFRFQNDHDSLQVKHTMKANGFEQSLIATLKR